MPRVRFTLDDETAARTRAAAQAEGVSLGRGVVGVLRGRLDPGWPADVVALAGAWAEDRALDDDGEGGPGAPHR